MDALLELGKALAVLGVVLGLWLLVQAGWRRVFGTPPGEDALAGRTSCGGCGCATPCREREEARR